MEDPVSEDHRTSEQTLVAYHRRMRRVRRAWYVLTVGIAPLVALALLGSLTPDVRTDLADAYADNVAGFVTLVLLVVVCYAVAAVWLRWPARLERRRIALVWGAVVASACWILLPVLFWFVSHRSA